MIYDCFIFYNELDILRVRLNEMAGLVDKFVIVESDKTFQGKPKPLHFAENRHLFAEFEPKIIYQFCEMPDTMDGHATWADKSEAWRREYYQRDFIKVGLSDARENDLVIISDVDEIICARALSLTLRTRRKYDLTIFSMPNFTGFYNRQMLGAPWLLGPRMIEFKRFTTPQKMRMTKAIASRRLEGAILGPLHTRIWNHLNLGMGAPVRIIQDAGWHFTSIGDWKNWRNKVDAFAHEELKESETYLHEEAFMESVRSKTRPVSLSELPDYIQKNASQFSILE